MVNGGVILNFHRAKRRAFLGFIFASRGLAQMVQSVWFTPRRFHRFESVNPYKRTSQLWSVAECALVDTLKYKLHLAYHRLGMPYIGLNNVSARQVCDGLVEYIFQVTLWGTVGENWLRSINW